MPKIPFTLLCGRSMFSRNPVIGGNKGVDPVALTITSGFKASTNGIVAYVFVNVIKFFNLLARRTK